MKLVIAFFHAGLLMAGEHHVVIATDSSLSNAPFLAQSKSEQRSIVESLPSGSRLTIFTVGGTTRRIFDGELSKAGKEEAIRQIESVRANERNTDLALAVSVSIAALASSTAPVRQVWLFCDGGHMPLPGSTTRGKSFETILRQAVLPKGAELNVRLFGDEKLAASNEAIKIFRQTPGWKVALRIPVTEPPPPIPPPPGTVGWHAAALAATLIALAGLAYIWKTRQLAGVSGPLAPLEPEAPPPATPEVRRQYVLRATGLRATAALSSEETPELIVGDTPLADLYLPGCESGEVRLQLRPHGLTIENRGQTRVHAGRVEIASGRSLSIPSRSLEQVIQIRIGKQVLQLFPQQIVQQAKGAHA